MEGPLIRFWLLPSFLHVFTYLGGVFTYLFTFVESFVGGEYIIYLMEHVLYGAHILVLSGFYMIFV